MNAKVLSITNDYYEIKKFLYKYDFINEEQYNDDEYDLLVWLEGDCDRMTCEGEELYFGRFHSDYVWDDCFVVISTAMDNMEKDFIADFFNTDKWQLFVGGNVEMFEELDKDKYETCYYRGGIGYVYALYYLEK